MYVMVLNDGETYTGLEGCAIVRINDVFDDSVDLDHIVKAIYQNDVESLTEYGEPVDPKRIGEVVTRFSS